MSVLWIPWKDPMHQAEHALPVDEGCAVLADCLESEFAPVRGKKPVVLWNHEQVQAIITHLRAASQLLKRYDERVGE